MFEIRHYIRLETIWAQYQTYGVYRISVWTKLHISSSLTLVDIRGPVLSLLPHNISSSPSVFTISVR